LIKFQSSLLNLANRRVFFYTKTSLSSLQTLPKVCLKSSFLSLSQVAFVKLSLSFTQLTQVPSGLLTLFGLITTENDQNGQKFSFSFGKVHFVLFVRLVHIQNGSHHSFEAFLV